MSNTISFRFAWHIAISQPLTSIISWISANSGFNSRQKFVMERSVASCEILQHSDLWFRYGANGAKLWHIWNYVGTLLQSSSSAFQNCLDRKIRLCHCWRQASENIGQRAVQKSHLMISCRIFDKPSPIPCRLRQERRRSAHPRP